MSEVKDAISISDLYKELKFHVETSFSNIKLFGEISSFMKSSAGHYYFSLKDEDSVINCALFKFDAFKNKSLESIKDGEQVLVKANVSLYNKRSSVQLIVKEISLLNKKGLLKERYEKLKLKLSKEGLFDASTKKEIPANPKRIGVVSSLNAAGLDDFITLMKRNTFFHNILISPSLVQGEKAPKSIINAIGRLNKVENLDMIIILRGGGSIEDLWCYNNEELVRYVHGLKIPTLSAIGHERDYTLLDFVCDLRMETPSAAAEYLSQDQDTLMNSYNYSLKYLKDFTQNFLTKYKLNLNQKSPQRSYSLILKRFNNMKLRLQKNGPSRYLQKISLHEYILRLEDLKNNILMSIQRKFSLIENRMTRYDSILKTTNPDNVLKRGFVYIQSEENKIIDSSKKFKKSVKRKIHFRDGVVDV